MKKYIYFLFIFGIVGFMSSCFEDKGNYNYIELPDFYVDTVGKQMGYTLLQFSEFELESNLVYAGDKSSLDYTWSIYAATDYGSNIADTLSKEEHLSATINKSPGNYIIEFCAMEPVSGICATMRYNLAVESVIGTGLMVYYQQNGNTDCDMIRTPLFNGTLTESTVSRKLYSLANPDKPLTGEPVCIGINSGVWIYLLTDSELVRLSVEDFTIMSEFENLFYTAPEVCNPQGYYQFSSMEVLINDNQAYTLLPNDGIQYPLARIVAGGDYSAAPNALIGWGVAAIVYDQKQKRFLFGDTYSSEFVEIPYSDNYAFDMNNVGKDMLYMTEGYCDQSYAKYGYAVMETPGNKSERSLYVYTTAAYASDMGGYAILDLSQCNNMGDATYWAFSSRSPIMYYATTTDLYLTSFDLSTTTVVPATQSEWTCPAGEKITCMRLFSSAGLNLEEQATCKYLLIATYNGTEGKIYILEADVSSGAITPEAIEVWAGFGKIKDMQFKEL